MENHPPEGDWAEDPDECVRKERYGMRLFLLAALTAALAGCVGGRLPEVDAEVEATSLANIRTVNLFSLSLHGEVGELFNELLEVKLRERLAGYVDPGSRWTLTIVKVGYTTPHFKQKTPYYKMTLEAELVDMNGKRGWQAVAGTGEIVANPEWNEERIRVHLADAAAEALIEKLPLGRIEMGEEKLK